jgi:hypothetical protein
MYLFEGALLVSHHSDSPVRTKDNLELLLLVLLLDEEKALLLFPLIFLILLPPLTLRLLLPLLGNEKPQSYLVQSKRNHLHLRDNQGPFLDFRRNKLELLLHLKHNKELLEVFRCVKAERVFLLPFVRLRPHHLLLLLLLLLNVE